MANSLKNDGGFLVKLGPNLAGRSTVRAILSLKGKDFAAMRDAAPIAVMRTVPLVQFRPHGT
jgi:hypothetical protein